MKLGGFQPGTMPGGISDALLANQRLNIGFSVMLGDGWPRGSIARMGEDRRGLGKEAGFCQTCAMTHVFVNNIICNYTCHLWNPCQVQ